MKAELEPLYHNASVVLNMQVQYDNCCRMKSKAWLKKQSQACNKQYLKAKQSWR